MWCGAPCSFMIICYLAVITATMQSISVSGFVPLIARLIVLLLSVPAAAALANLVYI